MTTLYGIKNCATMKKAFDWLNSRDVSYQFHDYKKLGIDSATLEGWTQQVGWEKLLNTRGTTWRRLSPEQQTHINLEKAIALMTAQPSLIKRPIVEHDGQLFIGFDANSFALIWG